MIAFISATLEDPNDQEYIIHIYQKYFRLMYSTAGKYMSSQADRDDLVQECILKMIEKIDYIRELNSCTLPSYIVSITRNTAINHLKRQSLMQKHQNKMASQQTAEQLGFDDLAQLLFCKDRVAGVLRKLSSDERFLLEGKYVLGYSDKDLAKHLKCRPDSIRMKLTRARRHAFQLLSKQEGDNDD